MTGTLIHESFTVAPRKTTKGRWRIRLIEADVMGSTGYYSAEVLRRDGPKAFPAGTHVYFDHATESESFERPERSVKDLAGALIEDAQYEDGPDGRGLFARVQFFPDYIPKIEAMAEVMPVEMSIRAAGTIEENESGRIVTSIVHGMSVDVVTRAGAGGRLISMTEAAKPTAPAVANLSEADKKVMTDLGAGLTTLNTTMTAFLGKLEEAQKAKDEKAKLTVGQVSAKLVESALPPASQKRLAESYKDGDDLDAMITEEKAYVADLTESLKPGKVTRTADDKGQKPGTVETDDNKGGGGEDDIKESMDAFSTLFGN